MALKKLFFFCFFTLFGPLSFIFNIFSFVLTDIGSCSPINGVPGSSQTIASTSPEVLKNPLFGMTEQTSQIVDSVMSMVSHVTDDVPKIWEWIIEKFPSVLSDNPPNMEEIVEYVKSKLFAYNDWVVLKHRALPKHTLRIKQFYDLRIALTKQYVGYIDTETSSLFFWFFESRKDPHKDPLVLWLNGGPGCSSLLGLFLTLGPTRMTKHKGLHYNLFSWNSRSSLLFLDQPANTGFSYSKENVTTSVEAGVDFIAFLTLFYNYFSYLTKLDLHLAGESYAGHFLPIFASMLLMPEDEMKRSLSVPEGETLNLKINLKSLMIGNGYMDTATQSPFNYMVGCSGKYGPIFSEKECKVLKRWSNKCHQYMRLCQELYCSCLCSYAGSLCYQWTLKPYIDHGRDIYDVTHKCKNCTFHAVQQVEEFLNDPAYKKLLGVEKPFMECNRSVTVGFYDKDDPYESVAFYIVELLEAGIHILMFVGSNDVICNWYGIYAFLDNLEWKHQEDFVKAPLTSWRLKKKRKKHPKGYVGGEVKFYDSLTLLRVYDAGHSVGADLPGVAFDFYESWMKGDYTLSKSSE